MASLGDLPSCALTCLLTAITNSTCPPTDLQCSCSNSAVTSQATDCILSTCTMVDTLSAQNVTNTLCGVKPALDESWVLPTIVLLCLMVIVVAMRVLARAVVDMPFWWDDWMSFTAMVFCIALTITGFQGMRPNGFGKDIWAVQEQNITEFLKGWYIAAAMYLGARSFTRVSIMLFYLRVFTVKEARRKIVYTLVLQIVVSVTYTIVMMFQCTPVSLAWTQWDLQHSGRCIDLYHFMISGWSILIAIDLWVMWLPLRMVANLQLSLRKKLLVSVMFATGTVVTAIGVAKLPLVYGATHSTNPTHDLVHMSTYCQIEVDLGVICCCMPSLPALFRPLAGRLWTGRQKLPSKGGQMALGDYMTPWSRRNASNTAGDEPKTTSDTTSSAASCHPAPLPSCDSGFQYDEYEMHGSAHEHAGQKIQAVTTIDQTYWRSDPGDAAAPGAAALELGHGAGHEWHVRSQAWGRGGLLWGLSTR